jgi:hypothetical protein
MSNAVTLPLGLAPPVGFRQCPSFFSNGAARRHDLDPHNSPRFHGPYTVRRAGTRLRSLFLTGALLVELNKIRCYTNRRLQADRRNRSRVKNIIHLAKGTFKKDAANYVSKNFDNPVLLPDWGRIRLQVLLPTTS